MRKRLLVPLILVAAAALPASALAGTAAYDAGSFRFSAAPGEANYVHLESTTSCDGLAAPCLSFRDSPVYPVAAPAGCIDDPFLGILCPLPSSVVIDVGDGVDFVTDWDGPSSIHAGPGEDVIRGEGGNDVVDGGDGVDVLIGGPGSDTVNGGPAGDILESYIDGLGFSGPIEPADTAGADSLSGGPGNDTVSYEARNDPITVAIDGQANDGAPGEGDDIASDVEIVKGGTAGDTMTGSGGPNWFYGMDGNDNIQGGAGDDNLRGDGGDDTVLGEDGTDDVSGGGEDDVLDGGRGTDHVYGEYVNGCIVRICVGGADEIRARDGARDVVDCGEGTDRAALDQLDETIDTCEAVDRAATDSPGGGRVLTNGIVVRMTVPGAGRVTVRATARGARKPIKIGRVSRVVRRAGPVELVIKMSAASRRALRARGKLRASLRITFQPRRGRTTTVRRVLTLLPTGAPV